MSTGSTMKRRLLRISAVLLLIYTGLCAVLWLQQDGIVFHPRTMSVEKWNAWVARADVTELVIERGGETLRGYLRPGDGTAAAPTVIYFGGNAELATGRRNAGLPEGWGLATVPYRGYGASTGSPGGAEILEDALAVYDALVKRPEVDGSRVVTWGLSLGTGVAVHVARHRPVAGVVLLAPYGRLSAIGQDHYPWMPVSLLFRHEVDAAADAREIDAPMLGLHGENDRVIPIAHGRALQRAWKGPVTWHERQGRGHNGLEGRFFAKALAAFLGGL